ncbi:hypothetical protein, partial [Thiolapillus sp.]|uniref:hypothetical protein n=1 Tax=Thiolapillus sp. TaxID=2017437 RepID=UPI003AF6B0AF
MYSLGHTRLICIGQRAGGLSLRKPVSHNIADYQQIDDTGYQCHAVHEAEPPSAFCNHPVCSSVAVAELLEGKVNGCLASGIDGYLGFLV